MCSLGRSAGSIAMRMSGVEFPKHKHFNHFLVDLNEVRPSHYWLAATGILTFVVLPYNSIPMNTSYVDWMNALLEYLVVEKRLNRGFISD